MTRSRPSSPVCGSFAASAGAGPPLRPSRARSESRARPAALMPASSVCHRVTRSFFMPMTNTPFRRGAKLSVPISSSVIAAMVMALAVQGAAAAPARTPDQQLVAGLRTARAASQTALSSISPASPTGAKKAATELSRAIKGIDAANNVGGEGGRSAADAVCAHGGAAGPGARETGAIRRRRRTLRSRTREAPPRRCTDVGCAERLRRAARERLPRVRHNPQERGLHREARLRKGGGVHTGPSPRSWAATSSEVVIGTADRRTANAGEPGAASRKSRGLPISLQGPRFPRGGEWPVHDEPLHTEVGVDHLPPVFGDAG